MYTMTKGGAPVTVTGTKLSVEGAWKSSGGGDKSFAGKLKAAKGVDLDLVTVGLLGSAPKGICWHDDTDPFNNGSLTAGKDATGRRKLLGKNDPISREAHDADLSKIPSYVDTLIFSISAYKPGVSFSDVSSVTCNISVDHVGWEPLRVTVNSRHNTCVMLRATRAGDLWQVSLVDELVTASSQDQLMSTAATYV